MTDGLAREAQEAHEAHETATMALESIAWIAGNLPAGVKNDLDKLVEQVRTAVGTMAKSLVREIKVEGDHTFQRITDLRTELASLGSSIEAKIRLDRIETAYNLRLLQLHRAQKASNPLFSAGQPALDLIEIIAESTDGEWTRDGLNDFRSAIVRDARMILKFANAGDPALGQKARHQDRFDEIVLSTLDFLDGDDAVERHLTRAQMASHLRGFILQAFNDRIERVKLEGANPDCMQNPVRKLIALANPLLEEVRAYLDGNDDADMAAAYEEFASAVDAASRTPEDLASSPENTMNWLNTWFQDRAKEDPEAHTAQDAAQVAQAKKAFIAMLAALRRMILEVPMGAGQVRQVVEAIALAEGKGA
jgi:hypothetical protein